MECFLYGGFPFLSKGFLLLCLFFLNPKFRKQSFLHLFVQQRFHKIIYPSGPDILIPNRFTFSEKLSISRISLVVLSLTDSIINLFFLKALDSPYAPQSSSPSRSYDTTAQTYIRTYETPPPSQIQDGRENPRCSWSDTHHTVPGKRCRRTDSGSPSS